MENTGIYHRPLVAFLQRKQAFVWVEHPVTIKWSMGLQRGETDNLDAQRIGLYAFRDQDKAKAYNVKAQSLQRVSELLATRERLLKAEHMLLAPIKELKELGLKEEKKVVRKACKQSILTLKKEIKAITNALEDLVKEHPAIEASYHYIRSVAYVGTITALQVLLYTHDFERFASAKKLPSYAGVAPFASQSGSIIRVSTQVHFMANKSLKKAFHMCAVNSIRWSRAMRIYFASKLKEVKTKMGIINAIRHKLLQRFYAFVKERRMYLPYQVA